MAAPKVYKSTDANAPVLTGVLGSLVALLDAVLISGYGTKAPIGWTKAFAGTNKAVYRPAMGDDRLYYRIEDTLFRGAWLSVYESMSSVNAGSGLIPSLAAIYTDNGPIIAKSTSNDTTARPWCIVGDAYGFYLFSKFGSDFFGDFCTFNYLGQGIGLPGTVNNAMFICGGAGSWEGQVKNDPQFRDYGTDSRYSRIHRSWDGATRGVGIAPHIGSSVPFQYDYSAPYPSTEGKEYLSDSVYFGSTDRPYSPRVKMPGLRIGAHTGVSITECGYDSGDNMLRFAVPLENQSWEACYVRHLAIDISEGYRP